MNPFTHAWVEAEHRGSSPYGSQQNFTYHCTKPHWLTQADKQVGNRLILLATVTSCSNTRYNVCSTASWLDPFAPSSQLLQPTYWWEIKESV